MEKSQQGKGERSRRSLLAGGALAAGAVAGGALVAAAPVANAADGKPLVVGRFNDAYAKTNLAMSSNAPALVVENVATNRAIQAVSRGNGVPTVEVYAKRTAAGTKPVALRAIAGNLQQKWRDLLTKVSGAVQVAVDKGTAIHGIAGVDGAGVRGDGWDGGPGVLGVTYPTNPGFAGVEGKGHFAGLFEGTGTEPYSIAVYAIAAEDSEDAVAIRALGDIVATGAIYTEGAATTIDHPLHPGEKYLSHAYVDSPERKTVHDGVVTANGKGEATVELPAYIDALNGDFRYQLTPIGKAAPDLHVSSEVDGSTFRIGGANPGQRISWQLTGVRKDAWARKHRVQVERDKPGAERGKFLYPEGFGADASKGLWPRR